MNTPAVVPPETRDAAAKAIVTRYANYSLVPGILPTPILDIALLIGIQIKMVSQLSTLYNVQFSNNLGKSIISSLLGSVIPTKAGFGATGFFIKSIPFVGGLLNLAFMPAFSWAATYAIGKVFTQHFESGGTMLTFDPHSMREYFRQEFDKEYATRMQQTGSTQQPEQTQGAA